MSRISRLRSMTLTLSRLSRAGAQLVVGHENAEAGLALGLDQLLGLALADVPVRVDMPAVLPLGPDDVGAGGRGEVGELGERLLGGPPAVVAGINSDEERLLDGRGKLDEIVVGSGHVRAG
jgi:hypothetical protein